MQTPTPQETPRFYPQSKFDKFAALTAPYTIEFIGTFFLTLTVAINSSITGRDPSHPLAAFAIGAVLMSMIFMGGHISGGHYNPCVTLGVRMGGRGKISNMDTAIYIVVQLLAGVAGAAAGYGLTDSGFAPAPVDSAHSLRALFVEFFFAFALISTVLNVATTRSQSGNSFFGLAIGFTVLAGAITVGDMSGAVFNPAVATGGILVKSIAEAGTYKYIWIYWVAPITASFGAAALFRLTNTYEYDTEEEYVSAHLSYLEKFG